MRYQKDPACYICGGELFLGGLCKIHHDEEEKNKFRNDRAYDLLRFGTVDGIPLKTPIFKKEYKKLYEEWSIIINVLQTRIGLREMPLEEAEAALSWCKALAMELIDADEAKQSGREISYQYYQTHEWVWERFKNLKAGRMSNGLPRAQ